MCSDRKSITLCLLIIGSALVIISCANSQTQQSRMYANNPYTTPIQTMRNPLRAQELTQQAAKLINTDPKKARELLNQALTADLFHGPAHNNLGVIYLNQDKLYEAASEFEWARKLMPGHPDPRMNLALTLEYAGQTKQAITEYANALETYPNHIQTIQALTSLQIRSKNIDDNTQEYLHEIAMRGTTENWRDWAKIQLTR